MEKRSNKLQEVQQRVAELEEESRRVEDARAFHVREAEKNKEEKKLWRWRQRREESKEMKMVKAISVDTCKSGEEKEEVGVLEQLEVEENEEEEEKEEVGSGRRTVEGEGGGEEGKRIHDESEMRVEAVRDEREGEKVYFSCNSYNSAVHRRIAIDLFKYLMSFGMKKTEAYLQTLDAMGISMRTLF